MNKIPFSAPDIETTDLELVSEVIQSGWMAEGKYATEFESLFCKYTGAGFSTTVSSCTAGLHLSCLATGIGVGDEVIVPAQTHTATAHAVEYCGAKAIFCDISISTGNLNIDDAKLKLSQNTKAMIIVHMAGMPCEMDEVLKFCQENDLELIEDCAHALGTRYDGAHVGRFGSSGCFSFYPTKQITTGDGGLVISDNQDLIERVRRMKAFGIDVPPHARTTPGVYDVGDLGYNYRMTDFQAALGVRQLERYPLNLKKRRKNARTYIEILKDVDGVCCPTYSEGHSFFIFQILLDLQLDRDRILIEMKERGIGASIHYAMPVPMMSYYKNKYQISPTDFPHAVDYGRQNISLPVHQGLSEADIRYICDTLVGLIGVANRD